MSLVHDDDDNDDDDDTNTTGISAYLLYWCTVNFGNGGKPARNLYGYSLFYDAFSVTRQYSVYDRISEWWWIGNNFVRSGRGLILRYYPGIGLEGLSKTMNEVNQDRRYRGRESNKTSRIRSRNVNHLTTTFGEICMEVGLLRNVTEWSTVHVKKLIVTQLAKNFLVFRVLRRTNAPFTRSSFPTDTVNEYSV
jgi:hypothetical protein